VAGGVAQREPGRQRQEAAQPGGGADDGRGGDDQADLRQDRADQDEERDDGQQPGAVLVLLEAEGERPAAQGQRSADRGGDQADDRVAPAGAHDATTAAERRDDVLPGGGARGQDRRRHARHDPDEGERSQLQRPDVRREQELVEPACGDQDTGHAAQRPDDDADDPAEQAQDQALPQDHGADLPSAGAGRGEQAERPALPAHPDGEGGAGEQGDLGHRQADHEGDGEHLLERRSAVLGAARVVVERDGGPRRRVLHDAAGEHGHPDGVEVEHLLPGDRGRGCRRAATAASA
jgi:hypothetical protein